MDLKTKFDTVLADGGVKALDDYFKQMVKEMDEAKEKYLAAQKEKEEKSKKKDKLVADIGALLDAYYGDKIKGLGGGKMAAKSFVDVLDRFNGFKVVKDGNGVTVVGSLNDLTDEEIKELFSGSWLI